MRVLIACEFSGIVRDAFATRGHDAWSCDLLPCEREGQHLQQDIFTDGGQWALPLDFDLMIAHPPCTHLAVSGARWFKSKQVEQRKAIWFFTALVGAPVPRICVENPIGIMSRLYRKPDQIIQPYHFSEDASKATCLWLKNLPHLIGQNHVEPRLVDGKPRWSNQTDSGQNKLAPSAHRAADRARTYHGIAKAMAEQWAKRTQ